MIESGQKCGRLLLVFCFFIVSCITSYQYFPVLRLRLGPPRVLNPFNDVRTKRSLHDLKAIQNPDNFGPDDYKVNSQIARLNAVAAKLRAEAAELEVRLQLFSTHKMNQHL